LKAAKGDAVPLAAWDYSYYQEQLEQTRYAVSSEEIRQYFPVDRMIPAVLALYEKLFGVSFRRVGDARAWAPGVEEYAITDATSGATIGWFYLDIAPRPEKYLRPAHFLMRAGHELADGGYQRPIAAIIGNGPSAEPGKPALFSHRDATDFFHELGHLMHSTMSTAPYATLHGTNVRADFVEAPAQMLENWMWQPAIVRRVSSHVVTGQPMPEDLVTRLIARRHVADGVFWTRQAFLGLFDLTLHESGPKVDAARLWLDLMPRLTPLPVPAGTIPVASFMPVMGGYDARYYGYAWSRVYAQDMFTAFEREGLEDGALGRRFRREVLEPGGSEEPEELVRRFLGRPVSREAFYAGIGATH
jgi:thimet oligopeptidase